MVDTRSNTVYLGNGDVGIVFGPDGSYKKPEGLVVFRNQPKQPITYLPDNYSVNEPPTEIFTMNAYSDICLSFSSAESIDALISVLNAVKYNIFENKKIRKQIYQQLE